MRKTATHTQQLWHGIPSWQRSALALVAVVFALIQLGGSSAAVNDPPDIVGQWSAPVAWPLVAVHMSLEPTGQIFALDGFDAGPNSERLWDPATGTFLPVPYGRNLFCSGHIQLADGRTLLVGGHIAAVSGLADTTIFDPTTRTYFRGPDMSVGRWYPTATALPDGRVLTFAGDNIVLDRPGAPPPLSDASVNSLPAVFDPKTNAWTDLPGARLTSPLYPFMFVLSDGRIFDAGPDNTTRILNPGTWTWSTVGTSPFDGHSAVMYRPNKIMKSGAWADPDFRGVDTYASHGRTAVIDMNAGTPQWRETAAMANARSYHNLTLLPDGTVLASGGGTTSAGIDLENSVLPAEIWNPDTETWTTVASLQNGRLYHSTALLLPDGRVLMAGGGQLPGTGAVNQTNAEIYSPPYLFKGPRPTITSAPATAGYGTSFDVTTPNATQVAKVSLIRLPSVTHANDMNQRFQLLNFSVGAGRVTVDAPATSNLAPPGDYMLFLVDTNGVPSVASFIRVSAANDTTPPTAPANLTGTPSPGQVSLSWSPASDAGGVTVYNVHRSTTPGFTPTTANRVARPTGTGYIDGGLVAGTYYHRVTAEDEAGNVGPASNEATATVPTGPPPGLVAAYGFDEGSGSTTADHSGNGNTGTLTSTAWAGAGNGRFGNALSFNGVSSFVQAGHSSSLDLTTGMSLEAWVRPSALSNWATAVLKESPGYYTWALYANNDANRPATHIVNSADRSSQGPAPLPLNTWSHLAATYDGSVLALYLNGTQVSQTVTSGALATSGQPLKVGGNAIWGEWFNGLIDEVRVYNRALSVAEVQADMGRPLTNPDAVPPSAPGVLSVAGGLSSAQLSWGAASDDVGVVRYNVHRGTTAGFTPSLANRIAQPTGLSYTDTVAAGSYFYRVTAEDGAGNVGPVSNEASATVGDTQSPGAPGTLGAVGAIGRATLSWGAASDNVGVVRYNVHRGTSAGFTPSSANRIAQPATPGYVDNTAPGTYFYRVTAEDGAGNIGAASNEASATVTADTAAPSTPAGLTAPVTGSTVNLSWSASTDNVGVVRYNLHRSTTSGFTPTTANRIAQPSSTSHSDPGLAIGSYFYKLTAEDAAGNTSPASTEATATIADATPPSAPGTLTATATASTINLGWSTATDNVAVTRYNLHRGSTSGFTPTTANRVAQPTGTNYADTNLAAGTYFYKLTAEDAAGNISPVSNTASATVADTTPPTTPTLSASGAAGQANLSWTAATDNIAVTRYNLHRSTTSGFTPSTGNRIAQPTGLSHSDSGLAAGTYFYKLTAEDAAGNLSATTNQASATVTTAPPTGLVAAYAFDAGTGTGITDQSGNNNNGTASNTSWAGANAGKYGNALNFNGTNASVNIPDSNSLDLTTGMTLEAWVRPTDLGNTYRTTLLKESTGGSAYSLYANGSGNDRAPIGEVAIGGFKSATGTTQLPLNTWSHIATTYNGSVLALYVDGTQAAQLLVSGQISTTTGPLKVGGNAIWGEWFNGLIDEVRVYNRALSVAEVQADMGRPLTNPDAVPPSAPGVLSVAGGLSSAQLSWGAASDDVGVVRYNVHRGTTAGFTPSLANRIAQPTGLSYTDTVAAGSYFYRVTAEDGAGNVGPVSNEASATVGDTQSPGAPGTLGAVGAIGRATLSWGAASDNVGVVRYNVHRGTSAGFTPSSANRIAQPATPGYVDNTAPGTYFYRVTAEDGAGNIGAASNEASATVTADTAAPSTPAGLTAPVTGSTVNLSWSASTDNVGVVRYNLHRSTTSGFTPTTANRIAQPSSTSHSDPGLAIGSYFYKLTAEDAAGNTSPASTEATATIADATPPSAPGTLTATATASTINLGWSTATDNVAVTRYNLHRGSTSGFTPTTANRVAQPTGTNYADTNLAAGTYFYKLTAEDAAGNISPVSNTASATVADTTPPTTPTLSASGAAGQANLSWTAATDNIAVTRYNLHRSTTSGFTPSTGNRIAQPTGLSHSDSGLAAGTYFYKLTAEDAAGNLSATTNQASATVTTAPPTGLVAAYAFDAGTGTGITDQSGNNNNGTASNTSWAGANAGKYGNALNFNGTNASVNIPDSNSLDLTTGMTLEAWVRPTDLGNTYRTTLLKESTGGSAYSLYANGSGNDRAPIGEVAIGGFKSATGTTQLPLNTWSHIATTYNGSVLALYVDGTQAAQLLVSGQISTTTGPLKVGGNAIWGEWFNGLIDEVRVYNRALSVAEVQADMGRPLTNPDAVPPSAPGVLSVAGGLSSAQLSWGAASDDVGVVRYNVHRGTTAGFTPSLANRIAQPTGLSYTDTVAAGSYFYRVTAEDGAGNVGPVSNEASATVGDTQSPGAPGTLGAVGAIGRATLSWGAASDNVGVVRYNVHRGTSAGFTPSSANRIAQPATPGYVDNTAPGTYFYRVTAEDGAGNIGAASNEASATVTADTAAPSTPAGLTAPVTGSTVNLSWSASTDNVGVVRYNLHRSTTSGFTPTTANRIAQPSSTSHSDPGLAIGSYFYKLTAEDAAGNTSPASTEATATIADATPPSAPGTLTATATASTINLGWSTATDNVAVTRYNLHRGSTSGFTPTTANRVAQPTGTNYADTNLAAGTYFYKLTAEDAAGNISPVSNTASATVADTTPPTTPTLSASGAAGQANLSWTAATDNIAVTRYNLHRSTTSGFTPSTGNRIAQPTGLSHSDSGLAAGTYFYKLTAEDAAGNLSATTNQASATVTTAPPTGLVAAYAFDAGTGTGITDQSGNNNNGTASNTSWAGANAGKYGNALNFNGTNASVNIPDSNSLDLTNGLTIEAWVRPAALPDWATVAMKESVGWYAWALYGNNDANRPAVHILNTADRETRGPAQLPINSWSHLAATYNGSVLALFLNGNQISQTLTSGAMVTTAQPLKIGGNAIWGEWFNGLIDEVRVYNRALTVAQIETDMYQKVSPDSTGPTLTARTPAPSTAGVHVGMSASVTFDEPINPLTITSSTFQLRDPGNTAVPVTVTYDRLTSVATLTPHDALVYGATYTLVVDGGPGGVADTAGNTVAADISWSFTTEVSPPQVLVLASTSNRFGSYLGEILRTEGLNAFTVVDLAFLSPALLSNFDVVVLGETLLSAVDVSTLTGWVNGGGNLVAMRPDKQLAGLLGLSDAGTTLANAYLRVETSTAAGTGIVGSTIQFHGTADRYTLSGATAVATLFSNATTATSNPAVTLRSVGSSGGQAAAFTYDLARSVVYTRQGNPAWASQERDGVVGIRPDDMFYGARAGDVQPDWVDTNKIAIPQADEQQRLLLNLITLMNTDQIPLPRFWYLPRGEKAAVVLSGDDHSPTQSAGFTAANFDSFKQMSSPGCIVAAWECVRSTSYVYPGASLTPAQANGYLADGFEIALHPVFGSCPTTAASQAELDASIATQLGQFQARYTGIPAPVSNRSHCVYWPDWASNAKAERGRGIRMDANYYHYPTAWIGNKPGFLNGGGLPMRFADLDGNPIDVYQQNTNMNDEAGQAYPATVNALLDNAVGPLGYYGTFGVNIHNDNPAPQASNQAIVASAQARSVPLISYKQLLDWVDGRDNSTIRGLSWNAGTLQLTLTVAPGANGLQAMLPLQGPTGTLSVITRGGTPVPHTVQTIKGIPYAFFDAATASFQATYS